MALTPESPLLAARNPGPQGTPKLESSRCVSTVELWPGLVSQAGDTYVLSGFCYFYPGNIRAGTQYLAPGAGAGPLGPSSPSPQQTKNLGAPESKKGSG